MDGIIYPCTHVEDEASPETEEGTFITIQKFK
jgi:5'-3' exonuclease